MAIRRTGRAKEAATSRPQSATFRFYAELNDFLGPSLRQRAFDRHFDGRPAVKDVIEAIGVPHTEIDLVLIDGRSVSFSEPLADGSRVAVYPVFEAIDIGPVLQVRPRPLREPKFLLDVHLGRLAMLLRLLGFDTSYANDRDDGELATASRVEGRTLLTRDHGLLKRSTVTHGYFVRERAPRQQAVEVVRRFDLAGRADPFSRCLRCNDRLTPVARHEVLPRLPRRAALRHDEFRACAVCHRVYWKGTHYWRMVALVEQLLVEAARGDAAAG